MTRPTIRSSPARSAPPVLKRMSRVRRFIVALLWSISGWRVPVTSSAARAPLNQRSRPRVPGSKVPDPGEVVGMAFGGRLRRSHAADPVFVDRTGRRRRIAAVAGGVAGIVLILTTLTMLVGFTGVGGGHLPGLPGIGGAATGAAQVPGQ